MWRDVNTLRAELLLVYFRLGRLQRVSTYVQQMWGIIGHVTVEAGNMAGTDGAPPQYFILFIYLFINNLENWHWSNTDMNHWLLARKKNHLCKKRIFLEDICLSTMRHIPVRQSDYAHAHATPWGQESVCRNTRLKVHNLENFFGSNFEFYTFFINS